MVVRRAWSVTLNLGVEAQLKVDVEEVGNFLSVKTDPDDADPVILAAGAPMTAGVDAPIVPDADASTISSDDPRSGWHLRILLVTLVAKFLPPRHEMGTYWCTRKPYSWPGLSPPMLPLA